MDLLYQAQQYRTGPMITMLTAATKAQIDKHPNRNIQLANIKASQRPDNRLKFLVRVVSISSSLILCQKNSYLTMLV